jgi:Mn2+/Fe2+ NRAMP family transporter
MTLVGRYIATNLKDTQVVLYRLLLCMPLNKFSSAAIQILNSNLIAATKGLPDLGQACFKAGTSSGREGGGGGG